jgi:ATP-dependent DNA helicase RecQ
MAREYPTSTVEFSRIPGVGAQKLAEFANPFTAEIREYLATHNKKTFAPLTTPEPELAPLQSKPTFGETGRETLRLFDTGLDPAQIAERRRLAESTIWSHLASAVAAGKQVDLRRLITEEQETKIRRVLAEIPGPALAPAKEKLGDQFTYGQVRLVAAAMGRL